jgi:hypothetical protein
MLVEGGAEIRGSRALELAARTGHVDNVVRLLDLGETLMRCADKWWVSHEDKEEEVRFMRRHPILRRPF